MVVLINAKSHSMPIARLGELRPVSCEGAVGALTAAAVCSSSGGRWRVSEAVGAGGQNLTEIAGDVGRWHQRDGRWEAGARTRRGGQEHQGGAAAAGLDSPPLRAQPSEPSEPASCVGAVGCTRGQRNGHRQVSSLDAAPSAPIGVDLGDIFPGGFRPSADSPGPNGSLASNRRGAVADSLYPVSGYMHQYQLDLGKQIIGSTTAGIFIQSGSRPTRSSRALV